MKRRDAMRGIATGLAAAVGAVATPDNSAQGAPTSAGTARSVRFAHLTDVHVYSGRSAALGLAAAIGHVHGLMDPPEFIINGGDAVNDAPSRAVTVP